MAKLLPSYIRFVSAGLLKHQQTGAIIPSQKFLIDKMIQPIPPDYRGTVVELGAGNGALTTRLARKCPSAQIIACEINPVLARDLRGNLDRAGINGQVRVIPEPANVLLQDLRAKVKSVDFIISGIPMANVRKEQALALIQQIRDSLSEGGMYIQFQHSLMDRRKIQEAFGQIRTVPVLLNFPPAFVYYARRQTRPNP